jgi:hypothetical protein
MTDPFSPAVNGFTVTKENDATVVVRNASVDASWIKQPDSSHPVAAAGNPIAAIAAIEIEVLECNNGNMHFGFTTAPQTADWIGAGAGFSIDVGSSAVYKAGAQVLAELPGRGAAGKPTCMGPLRRYALQLDLLSKRLDAFIMTGGVWAHAATVATDANIPDLDKVWYPAVSLNFANDKVRLRVYDARTRPAAFGGALSRFQSSREYAEVLSEAATVSAALALLNLAGLRQPRVTVAGIGKAGVGKSAVINALMSVIAELRLDLVTEGATRGGTGQVTQFITRVLLLSESINASVAQKKWRGGNAVDTSNLPFDIELRDVVGARCQRELEAALLGKTRDGETWPIDPKADAGLQLSAEQMRTSKANEAVREGIERRAATPRDAVQCAFIVVDAASLETGVGDDKMYAEMRNLPNQYSANDPRPGVVHPLPMRVIVTKVDDYLCRHGVTDRAALLAGPGHPLLAPLYTMVEEQLGVSPAGTTLIGWLGGHATGGDTIDFRNPTDPCVIVLRHFAVQIATTAAIWLTRVLRTTPPALPM